jgi:hypothetical protein
MRSILGIVEYLASEKESDNVSECRITQNISHIEASAVKAGNLTSFDCFDRKRTYGSE